MGDRAIGLVSKEKGVMVSMIYLYFASVIVLICWYNILIVLLMQLREIKVKKGSQLTIIVDEEGDLIPQKGSQFSYIEIRSWSNPLSPIKRTYYDIQDDGWKAQAKSNKTSINFTSCRCKKSKCLKSYCDCFADGRECSKECDCTGC